ncbi:GOLPH3/VPS74 family protein [Paenibacillus radicis (ex Xue et al. 2023)]|uniref:GPP34 family phosphoprotein n=1 Tax=Paenibacillus radicis (ex Xue et al. 2023) TaxID=2972489 RepID=A0ABT1YL20_9BACL|nr:GPP34 family phosphoprotein [Paenibacillus radicis (ex Xue et al. 2023)]MCR8633410.1 GPP34 family phosphoprotein [Paenibacillus radicis (ex Xue et al. 2023)]
MQLSVSEQFILLALDRSSGLFNKQLSGMLGFYLAASGLLELILSDTIRLTNNDQVMFNKTPPAGIQAHLELITDKINKKTQTDSIKNWIVSLYTWNSPTIQQQLTESMEAQGLMEKHQKKWLSLLPFTYWTVQENVKESLVHRLKNDLLKDGAINNEIFSVALLAAHSKILNDYLSPEENEQVKQRLVHLQKNHDSPTTLLWYNQVKRAYTEAAASSWSI